MTTLNSSWKKINFNILVFDFQKIYMLDFHNHSFVMHVMPFLLVYMHQLLQKHNSFHIYHHIVVFFVVELYNEILINQKLYIK